MKSYKKPEIISELIFEKTALDCDDYIYYAKGYEGCRDEYIGRGKVTTACADTHS
ncbi:MAG: hypothetical protein JXA60_11170 [Candidatus Coatesbacteria bacterium]|nr:hypothetical protein [Candidatus Coatesbacteria bacterium]